MRYSRFATVCLTSLIMSTGCGAPDEPEGRIIIITTDEPAEVATNNTAETSPDPDPMANNTTDPDPDPDPQPTNNTTDPDPDPQPDPDPDPEPDPEPCGNGTLDAGETCDGNCPSSCNDGDPCTMGTMGGDAAICTAVCTYQADSACDSWEGGYTGTYYIKAEEKIGSSVINSMTCSGTFSASIDMSREDNLAGSADCDYGGSLGGFDSSQSATMTGQIAPDGTFSMRIHHVPGTANDGYFNVDGTVVGGTLVIDDTGSFRPHPQSAVGWETVIRLN